MPLKKIGSFVLIALIAAPAVLAGPSFSLKLQGGPGFWLTGGDFKTYLDSTMARWDYIDYAGTLDQKWKPLALEAGLQAVVMFNKRWGAAIGVGFIAKPLDLSSEIKYNWGYPGTENLDQAFRVSSIPISFDFLFSLPAGPVRLVLSAGPSLYLSRVKYEESALYSEPARPGQPNWKWDRGLSFQSGPKASLGFQAGLGLEVPLFGTVSLCFDGLFRMAAIEGASGDVSWHDDQTWTGGSSRDQGSESDAKMWFGTSELWGQTWHYFDISETKPTVHDESRLFKISLNGPVARIGIKIGI